MMEDIQVDGVAKMPPDTNNAVPSPAHNNTSDSAQQTLVNVLYSEVERLKTFPRQWTHALQKRDLAKHGFYYVLKTVTKCVFCLCVIGVENSQDSVDNLHKMNSPGCDFAHGRDVSKNIPLGDTSDYRYEKNRLISFLGAHWYAPVDIYDLAKFGFYWTGEADVGRCNFCRLEVRGWEPNDRGQSVHLWSHCPFMQGRAVGNVPLGEENNAEHVVHDGVVVARKDDSGPSTALVLLSEVRNTLKCLVCHEKELGIMFFPCHHVSACTECGSRAGCPICDAKLKAYMRVFLP